MQSWYTIMKHINLTKSYSINLYHQPIRFNKKIISLTLLNTIIYQFTKIKGFNSLAIPRGIAHS